jgi:hypothetical protein
MKPVDILGGVDSLDNRFGIESIGKRELDQDPIDFFISVQLIDECIESTLGNGV